MEEGQTTWGHVDFHKVTKGHEKPGEGSTAISGSSPSGKMSPVSEPGWAPHHVGEEYLGRGQERARSAKAQAHSAALEAHLPLQLICYCSCHFPLCSVTSSLLQQQWTSSCPLSTLPSLISGPSTPLFPLPVTLSLLPIYELFFLQDGVSSHFFQEALPDPPYWLQWDWSTPTLLLSCLMRHAVLREMCVASTQGHADSPGDTQLAQGLASARCFINTSWNMWIHLNGWRGHEKSSRLPCFKRTVQLPFLKASPSSHGLCRAPGQNLSFLIQTHFLLFSTKREVHHLLKAHRDSFYAQGIEFSLHT